MGFSQDMFSNMLQVADWQTIKCSCEYHVNENLRNANRKHHQYDYALGQQVVKKVHDPPKLGVKEGCYTIGHVHVNGNLTLGCRLQFWLLYKKTQ